MTGLAITAACIAIILLIAVLTAPEGYQDSEGFHFGRPEIFDPRKHLDWEA